MSTPPVVIIVPVYRGMSATQRCLMSILNATPRTAYQLVIIDDASPEPELSAWLDQFTAAHPSIQLLRQPINRGFVASVNWGMAQYPAADVILLNSDTAVANNWLDRLVTAAYSHPCVGTVTPLSNAGSIASYPHVTRDNPWPADDATRDALAATVNAGMTVTLPVGVGFCLFIRRHCLNQVGLFDAAQFGHGYGEEVEWCLRASAAGWCHLLATDVFVAHAGAVSFGRETATQRQAAAQALIDAAYPEFQQQVAAWFQRDPARQWRRRLDLARILTSALPVTLCITHNGGGGVERHVRDLAALAADRALILTLAPDNAAQQTLRWQADAEEFCAYLQFGEPGSADDDTALALLRSLPIARVHYHQVVGLPPRVLTLAAELGVPYDVTIHDYMVICPHIHLVTADGHYCREPAPADCEHCLTQRPPAAFHQWPPFTIASWREQWRQWLAGAAQVWCPSNDVARRLQRYWPELHCQVAPHVNSELTITNNDAPLTASKWIKVLILGGLSRSKGLDVVYRCAQFARQQRQPVLFRVLGPAEPLPHEWPDIPLQISGSYREQDLAALIALERADVFLFPAQVPETFSYTLSAAMQTGLPIVASALGAFPERLANYPAASLLPADSTPAQWLAQLHRAASVTIDHSPVNTPSAATIDQFQFVNSTASVPIGNLLAPARLANWSAAQFYLAPAHAPPPLTLSALYSAVLEYRHWQFKSELARLIPATELALADAEWDRRALRTRLQQVERDYAALADELNHQRTAHAEYVALLERERAAAQLALHTLANSRLLRWQHWWTALPARQRQLWSRLRQSRRHWRHLLRRPRQQLPAPPPLFTVPVITAPAARVTVIILLPLTPVDRAGLLTCLHALYASAALAQVQCDLAVLDDAQQTAAQLLAHPSPAVTCHPPVACAAVWATANQLAAAAATSDYLLMLDGNSVLAPDALAQLLQLSRDHPPARDGLLTAKLRYGDGPLLAAGGVIWRDGSVWHTGRGDDPHRSTFDYVRQLDVATWGGLWIKRAAFDRAGGFDPRWHTADAAAVALSLRVADNGGQVWYQPAAVLTRAHTHSRQPDSAQPTVTTAEQQLLHQHWGERLTARPLPGEQLPFAYASGIERRVLISGDHVLPPFQWQQLLTQVNAPGAQVSVVVTGDAALALEQQTLQQRGVEVLRPPHVHTLRDALVQYGAVLQQIVLIDCEYAAAQLPQIKLFAPQAQIVLVYLMTEDAALFTSAHCQLWWQQRQQELTLIQQCAALWIITPDTAPSPNTMSAIHWLQREFPLMTRII